MLDQSPISSYLKPLKGFLDVNDPAWKAWRMMKDENIKIIPVKKAGKIVGLVSDRDIVQISGFNGGQSMPVSDAMSLDPLVVSEKSDIKSVLKAMLQKDQQTAIAVDHNQEICGLFTWDGAFEFFLESHTIGDLKKASS